MKTTTLTRFAGMAIKQSLLSVAVAVLVLTISIPAYALNFFTDRASWEAALPGSFAPVDIASQVPPFKVLPAGGALLLPLSETLTFDIAIEGLQVPSSWATWSGGKTPAVLYTLGAESLDGTFGPQPVIAFGLEIEPNIFSVFNVSLTTTDGGTHTLTQAVNGSGGAQFFGWIGDVTSMQITCAGGCAGFAIGELVVGGFAGTPGKANCHGDSVSALAQRYGGLDTAATTLGFPSVQALQEAIRAFCGS